LQHRGTREFDLREQMCGTMLQGLNSPICLPNWLRSFR
jgi:hypothetical protein